MKKIDISYNEKTEKFRVQITEENKGVLNDDFEYWEMHRFGEIADELTKIQPREDTEEQIQTKYMEDIANAKELIINCEVRRNKKKLLNDFIYDYTLKNIENEDAVKKYTELTEAVESL